MDIPDSCFYAAYVTVKALTDILPAEVMESLTRHNTRIGIMLVMKEQQIYPNMHILQMILLLIGMCVQEDWVELLDCP